MSALFHLQVAWSCSPDYVLEASIKTDRACSSKYDRNQYKILSLRFLERLRDAF